MSVIAEIEEGNKLKGLSIIILFIMIVEVIFMSISSVLVGMNLTFGIGFMNVVLMPFIADYPIFGIPMNLLTIAVFSICIIIIWIFYGTTVNVVFQLNGNELYRSIDQGPMFTEKTIDTNDIDYMVMEKRTVVTQNTSSDGYGGGFSMISFTTLSAVLKGTRVENEHLFRHTSPDKVRNVAQKISEATAIPIK